MKADTRLRKLEDKARGDVPPHIAAWIAEGRYFDELTPSEQVSYCQYMWDAQEPPERYLSRLLNFPYTDHFQIVRRPPEPTEAEFRARVAEVQRLMEEKTLKPDEGSN